MREREREMEVTNKIPHKRTIRPHGINFVIEKSLKLKKKKIQEELRLLLLPYSISMPTRKHVSEH